MREGFAEGDSIVELKNNIYEEIKHEYLVLLKKSFNLDKKLQEQTGLYGDDIALYRQYVEELPQRLRELKERTNIDIEPDILAEVLLHYMRPQRKISNPIKEGIRNFKERFNIEVTSEISKIVYQKLLDLGDLASIENFQKETFLKPEASQEGIQKQAGELLKKGDYKSLKKIQNIFQLEFVPVSQEIAQAEYLKILENPKFATRGDTEIYKLYDLYSLTKLRPSLTKEQISVAYRSFMLNTITGKYNQLEDVIGEPPTEKDLQNLLFNWLSNGSRSIAGMAGKLITEKGIDIYPETARKSALHLLKDSNLEIFNRIIENIQYIEEISNSQISFESSEIETIILKVLETQQFTDRDCTQLDDLFIWFEKVTNKKPSQELVDKAYSRTFNQTVIYASSENESSVKAWNWLKEKYGLPSKEATQQVYLNVILTKRYLYLVDYLKYIEQFTNHKPDLEVMKRLRNEQGVAESEVKEIFSNFFKVALNNHNIQDIRHVEDKLGEKFTITDSDLQDLFSRELHVSYIKSPEIFEFLLSRNYLPNNAVLHEVEKKLFNNDLENSLTFIEKFKLDISQPKIQDAIAGAVLFCGVDLSNSAIKPPSLKDFSEEELARLFKLTQEKSGIWQDRNAIVEPFQSGVEIFGYQRMLEYIGRKGLNSHDAVHAFRNILELYRASGLSALVFYGQILQQVKMDNTEYSEGTAHHHLNTIAQTANKDIAQVIEKARAYPEIQQLQQLASTLNSPQLVFSSWINLKKYSQLEQLLGKSEVLDELKALKTQGKEKLYEYIATLAFHPDSKVNMSAVIRFLREPEAHLGASASHTPEDVQDRKKPSNYLHIPNLDLTANELRDALVEGRIDGLSVFTPLEIRYKIPLENFEPTPLKILVTNALGSKKENIKGKAKNPQKLYAELNKLFESYGVNLLDYTQGVILPEDPNLSQKIEALLYNPKFGMQKPKVKAREYVAMIGKKSDPSVAIAGNDTVNCMPFGDGKNTVYNFNPNTAQFMLRIVKGNGKERTIAQSVLTKDADIKTPVPKVISVLEDGSHREGILPADILSSAPVYLACDNIEVAPNYTDERQKQIIEEIYRDFFKEYMSLYAEKQGLNSKKVPIGKGYTDALERLPEEPNTFAPQAPVSYSDKTGDKVLMLDLESNVGQNLILEKKVITADINISPDLALPNIKGLGYLTFEDTLKVAYLEGKAYADNNSLMQYLFNIENGLIAKDINNSAKDRPNMSVKFTDETGRMRGYILTWEGRLKDGSVESSAGEFYNMPCIYISDLATDKESAMAGGRLMQGFTELYKQNYLDKGNAMPIFAQTRETTSYKIIKKQLDKIGKQTSFNFELIELPTYKVGNDTMHPIIIRPIPNN